MNKLFANLRVRPRTTSSFGPKRLLLLLREAHGAQFLHFGSE
jgi:hypothetical protein